MKSWLNPRWAVLAVWERRKAIFYAISVVSLVGNAVALAESLEVIRGGTIIDVLLHSLIPQLRDFGSLLLQRPVLYMLLNVIVLRIVIKSGALAGNKPRESKTAGHLHQAVPMVQHNFEDHEQAVTETQEPAILGRHLKASCETLEDHVDEQAMVITSAASQEGNKHTSSVLGHPKAMADSVGAVHSNPGRPKDIASTRPKAMADFVGAVYSNRGRPKDIASTHPKAMADSVGGVFSIPGRLKDIASTHPEAMAYSVGAVLSNPGRPKDIASTHHLKLKRASLFTIEPLIVDASPKSSSSETAPKNSPHDQETAAIDDPLKMGGAEQQQYKDVRQYGSFKERGSRGAEYDYDLNRQEFNERVEGFIAKFKRNLTMQRQDSFNRLLSLMGGSGSMQTRRST